MIKTYPWSPSQEDRLAACPKVDNRQAFPAWARAHKGQRVAIEYITVRGDRRRRHQYGYVYGVLADSARPDSYTIENNGETKSIHYRDVVAMYARGVER
jgi:hypothetical protein